MLKHLPSEFDGRVFRSRTEAKHAVALKEMGLPYEYEVQGYKLPSGQCFLPDFLISGRLWLEIKGAHPVDPWVVPRCWELAKETDRWAGVALGQPAPDAVVWAIAPERIVGPMPLVTFLILMTGLPQEVIEVGLTKGMNARWDHGYTPDNSPTPASPASLDAMRRWGPRVAPMSLEPLLPLTLNEQGQRRGPVGGPTSDNVRRRGLADA